MTAQRKSGPDGIFDMTAYSPKEFVPRGPDWPAQKWQKVLLSLFLIDLIFVLKCEKFSGIISRMDRRNLPKAWKKYHAGLGMSLGHNVADRHALIWLEEFGDMLIGHAYTYTLHTAKVGDSVTIWVNPHCGHIRRLRNHTRPRRWWQF